MKTCTKCGEVKAFAEFSKDARKRDGLHSSCKACDSATNAAWRAANPDKEMARGAARYAADPSKAIARNAAWYKANPDANRIKCQNRRARKAANGGQLSPGLAAKLFKLQRGKCACCGVGIEDGNHLDHNIPVALGGPNEDWNMQLLCSPCNQSKHAKHPVDFMQSRGFLL